MDTSVITETHLAIKGFYKQHPRLTKTAALGTLGITAYTMGGIIGQAAAIGGCAIIGGGYLLSRIPNNYEVPQDITSMKKPFHKALKGLSVSKKFLVNTQAGHFVLDAGSMVLVSSIVGIGTITGVAVICITGVMTSLAIDVLLPCGKTIKKQIDIPTSTEEVGLI